MVWSLEEIKDVEDLQLLSGHIYMILGNLEKAQVRVNNFLKYLNNIKIGWTDE